MNIKIICVGKIKEKSLTELIDEYKKRISKFASVEICEVPDEVVLDNASKKDIEIIKDKEGEKILKNIKPSEYVICLDLKGSEISSEEFSKEISNICLRGFSTITFVIGGSLGISKNVLEIANEKISFSRLTFPHQLFRLMLLEQIFRAFKIQNNEKYHL